MQIAFTYNNVSRFFLNIDRSVKFMKIKIGKTVRQGSNYTAKY